MSRRRRLIEILFAAISAAFLAADAPRLTTSAAVVVRAPAVGQWSVIDSGLSRVQPQILDAGDAVILSTPGRYVVVWAGGQQLLTADVVVGGTPIPPAPPMPTPTPPKPVDPPAPPPTPPIASTLFITVVYESQELTPDQSRVLRDRDLTSWLDAGRHKLREVDDDIKDADGKTPANLAKHLEMAKQVGLPAVIVTDAGGTVLAKFVLPETGAALLAKLKTMIKTGAKR